MIWLTWRQLRGATAMMAAALATLAAVLMLTGPGLATEYATGLTACTQDGDCARFFDRFFDEYQTPFLAVTFVVLALPALIGLFWGAPLITRELEAGTHLLVWNQSITRTRWLAVKLTLTGLIAVAAAGLCSLVVTWWAGPLDKSAVAGFTLMDPLVFGARGIVPMAYAALAFVLGVTAGMLTRRTLTALAVTLAVFVSLQVALPVLVRPHLLQPVSSTFELDSANTEMFGIPRDGTGMRLLVSRAIPGDTGAWVLSSHLLDPSGHVVGSDDAEAVVPMSTTSGPCAPAPRADGMRACLAEINRQGYRQQATYHPFDRFWPFQWIEIGIYALLTFGLTGLCFQWVRRRLS